MTNPRDGRSYEVRIWSTAAYKGRRGKTYRVRWRVGHRTHGRTLATSKAAESFRSELVTAHRHGEPFDIETGLPSSLQPKKASVSWYEHACHFVDVKWAHASARHRQGIAEALTTVTTALVSSDKCAPSSRALRAALQGWAFNAGARGTSEKTAPLPDEFAAAIGWIRRHSIPLTDLEEPAVIRRAVDACGLRLDGGLASPSTAARKRSALFSAVEFAVEQRRLDANPMEKLRTRRTHQTEEVDRRVVVNPHQARSLLDAVRSHYPSLEAFFACMYFAGLRPAEVRHLRARDLTLPESGWGEMVLTGSTQAAGSAWTDTGSANEDRSLKHRGDKDVRHVPVHPELVAILRRHLLAFESSPDGRLFVSRVGIGGRPLPRPFSKPLPMSTVYRAWKLAREEALAPEEVASPLARRPYDLRHACLSTWLNAGVPATQVAAWAGHSVNVLLRVYAKCVYGQEEVALRRIEGATGTSP